MKRNRKTNNTNLKNKNAITLIALVVTIVVLLILAGVSINLVLDNNGIIVKSKEARLENRAAQVEDEVGMWKQNNFINEESGQTQEEADTMLASLISRNLLKEDEIDRENEIITIKKNDGSILKQISYSKVTNIDENAKYYIVNINEYDIINNNTAKITTKLASTKPLKLAGARRKFWCTGLRDKETNSLQTFTKAYIIYNNQRVDISSIIEEKNGYNYIIGDDIRIYLKEQIENFDWDEFKKSEHQFIIEKDGIYYAGNAKVGEIPK